MVIFEASSGGLLTQMKLFTMLQAVFFSLSGLSEFSSHDSRSDE
jgi:hypothetical protein